MSDPTPLPLDEERRFLEEARRIVLSVRPLLLKAFATTNIEADVKSDGSLVTAVDREVEAAIRKRLTAIFPVHGIIGEEGEAERPDSRYQWIIDPLDGTRSFVRHIPTFGSMLALMKDETPVLGVIDHPALDACYSGGLQSGAYCNGERIAIRDKAAAKLDTNDILITSPPRMFAKSNQQEIFQTLLRFHPNIRIYNDCFGHTCTISGKAVAAVEYNLNLWDFAATQVLAHAAGGAFRILSRRCDNGARYYSIVFGAPSVVRSIAELLAEWPQKNEGMSW